MIADNGVSKKRTRTNDKRHKNPNCKESWHNKNKNTQHILLFCLSWELTKGTEPLYRPSQEMRFPTHYTATRF